MVAGTEGGRAETTKVPADINDPGQGHRDVGPQTRGFGGKVHHQRRSLSPPARSASVERNTKSESAMSQPSGTAHRRRGANGRRTAASSTRRAEPYASTGTNQSVAETNHHGTSTSALAAAKPPTELSVAVLRRKQNPVTPLVTNRWESDLRTAHLYTRYPQIPEFIRRGANAGFPRILQSFTPLNKESTEALSDTFNDIIQSEFNKGRYLGPFSREELEQEIGPFQSSPLSLVPKAGKPGKYRLIQNLSYPHTNQPTPSINARLNSNDFPCTWGTFQTVCTLIRNLPHNSQAAVRDIAEAY